MRHVAQTALQLVRRAAQRVVALPLRARLTGVALLLLCAALFEPHWTITRKAYDLVFTIDVTQSMNVLDYEIDGQPASRLAQTKRVLREALPGLPCGSRVGWAIFTEYRTLLLVAPIEVCDNYHELVSTLERIDGRMAWANASEVAKGLFWGLRTLAELGNGHGMVFLTDGHESPPLSPRHMPTWQPAREEQSKVRGLIVGVGGDASKPIPKLDPEGRPLGFWAADEVMQTDVFSAGRTTSSAGEKLVDESGKAEEAMRPTMTEHLSSLRGAHLQDLARETGLDYRRLSDAPALLRALKSSDIAHAVPYRADLRVLLAGGALALLLAVHLRAAGALLRRRLG